VLPAEPFALPAAAAVAPVELAFVFPGEPEPPLQPTAIAPSNPSKALVRTSM